MDKNLKVLIGILTIVPVAAIGIWIFYLMLFFSDLAEFNSPLQVIQEFNSDIESFGALFILLPFSSLLGMGLMIFYLVHVIKNERLKSNNRILWVAIIVFTHSIGQLVYFLIEIWPDKDTNR